MTIYLLISIILWIWDNRSFDSISQSNQAKKQAQDAYQAQRYDQAAAAYNVVVNGSLFSEPEARLNLAHSFFRQKKYADAKKYYDQITHVNNKHLSSQAYLQMGVIATYQKDTTTALDFFKKSLKKDTDNTLARYNYELLKTYFSGKEKKHSTTNTTQQQPQATPKNEQIATEMQLTEERKNILKRLQAMNITEAQAMVILEAMKNAEIQYIQQLKHRSPKDDSKGKW